VDGWTNTPVPPRCEIDDAAHGNKVCELPGYRAPVASWFSSEGALHVGAMLFVLPNVSGRLEEFEFEFQRISRSNSHLRYTRSIKGQGIKCSSNGPQTPLSAVISTAKECKPPPRNLPAQFLHLAQYTNVANFNPLLNLKSQISRTPAWMLDIQSLRPNLFPRPSLTSTSYSSTASDSAATTAYPSAGPRPSRPPPGYSPTRR
jgi:hypothetical protein